MYTVTTHGEVQPDHTLTVRVPNDVPPGPVIVTVTSESSPEPKIRTLRDLLHSGFVGMWADRDDLPKTNEEFAAWRKKLWEPRTD